jgi:outer membrane protein assembly factor BamB
MSNQRRMIELDQFWDALNEGQPENASVDPRLSLAVRRLLAMAESASADELFLRRLWAGLPGDASAQPAGGTFSPPKSAAKDPGQAQLPGRARRFIRRSARYMEVAAMLALVLVATFLLSGGDVTPDFNFWGSGSQQEEILEANAGGNAGRTGEVDTEPFESAPAAIWSGFAEGNSPSLLIADGALYAGSCTQELRVFDVQSGALLWDLGSLGIAGNPAIWDATLLLGSEEGSVYALDRATGTERWSFDTGDGSVCFSPLVIDGTAYFPDDLGNLYALDAEDGTLAWQAALPAEAQPLEEDAEPDCICLATISGDSDHIYAGTDHGRIIAFDRHTGDISWMASAGGRRVLGTVVSDGTVFIAVQNGPPVIALDAATGSVRWTSDATRVTRTRLSVADGMVIVTGWDGSLIALAAEDGTVQWAGIFGAVAQPLINDGMVFVGTNQPDAITVLDITTGARVWAFGQVDNDVVAVSLAMGDGVFVLASQSSQLAAFAEPFES